MGNQKTFVYFFNAANLLKKPQLIYNKKYYFFLLKIRYPYSIYFTNYFFSVNVVSSHFNQMN